jgi:5,5'-dehydrodivanillate O-demethylase
MIAEEHVDFVHTGPGTPAGRFLRRFWQPIYRASDLMEGRAAAVQIMSEDFTLYRGEGGVPHLLEFRCAHRRSQLSVGWVEDDCIRCFYHGWKYDGSGQCLEQPGEDEPFAHKVRLQSYPVREYLGLIFAYLGEGEPPPMLTFPDFEEPGVLEVFSTEPWPYNYFNSLDNSSDALHVAFVHRESRRRAGIEPPIFGYEPEETEYGIRYVAVLPGGQIRHVRYFFMPNLVQVPLNLKMDGNLLDESESGGAIMIRLLWRVPVTDESHKSYFINYLPLKGEAAERYQKRQRQRHRLDEGPSVVELGNAVLAGKLRLQDIEVADAYKLVQVEDYVAQAAQGVICDRSKDRPGRKDAAVILLRKIFEREVRCLAEGRPLKEWRLPGSFRMMAENARILRV